MGPISDRQVHGCGLWASLALRRRDGISSTPELQEDVVFDGERVNTLQASGVLRRMHFDLEEVQPIFVWDEMGYGLKISRWVRWWVTV